MLSILGKYRYEILIIAAVVFYALYFTIASFARYDNFYTGRFDLGNMVQTVWNTANGRIFELTDPSGTRQMSRLGVHADFILIFLTPIYMIWQNPKSLLLIQTIVLSLGGVFVYLIAKKVLKNKLIALVFGLSFLLNPAVQYTNLYDFHAVTLSTTFLLGAIFFILKKNYLLATVLLILAGLCKEQIWAIIALIGAYLFFFHKQRVIGAVLFLSGVGLFYYLVWIAIPHALGDQHFALSYYSDFGSNPTEVLRNIILSPVQTLGQIFTDEKLGYIAQLFTPYGYISFLAPIMLIPALPDIFISLLSNNPLLHQIYYQYSASSTPFIITAAIFGISRVRKTIPAISFNTLAFLIMVYTLIAAHTYGPLPFALRPNLDMFNKPLENRGAVEEYISRIPKEYSVSSTNNLGSHLSERQQIFTVPVGTTEAEIVMFLVSANDSGFSSEVKEEIDKLKADQNYKKAIDIGNFIVFERLSNSSNQF